MASNDVNEIQSTSQSLMSAQYAEVLTFLNQLREFAAVEEPDVEDPNLSAQLIDPAIIANTLNQAASWAPSVRPTAEHDPALPDAPDLVAIDQPPTEVMPALSVSAPSLSTIQAPSLSVEGSPSAPALLADSAVLPSAPSVSLPSPPAFQAIALPTADEVNLPEFTFSTPVSDLTAPTQLFSFNEAEYSSALSDALKAKILTDIESGGYGIDDDDERLLWDRARERAAVEANQKIEEALRAAASRGFSLPPGADMAAIEAAQQAALANVAGVDREIALKRADMYVENRKHAMSLAREVESLFISYRSAMMERALNAARAGVELGIAVFNAKRDKFLADLELYKAQASVTESRIRGELAKLEVYKAKVEGARVSAEVQKAQVEVYKSQIEGIRAIIDLYNAQLGGVKIRADIDRTRIEGYRAQVEAYATKVQLKNAEVGLYEARLRGDSLRVQAYEAQIRAYGATVEAFRTKAATREADARVQLASNQAQLDQFRSQVERFRAQLESAANRMRMGTDLYRADVSMFQAFAGTVAEQARLSVNLNEANSRTYSKLIDQSIAVLTARMQDALRLHELRLAAAKGGTDATTSLAVAAAQQITGLTQLLKES